jgi:hypothetical protein
MLVKGLLAALGSAKASTLAVVVAVVAGAGLCTALVVHTTEAMFSGGSSNDSDSWTTGTVALSDDDNGTALFDSAADGALTGGQTLTRCLVVRYDGTLTTSSVKLYGVASGDLGPYLDLTIDLGTGGGGGDCTGFTPTASGIFTGTLASFATDASSFATGVGTWSPASTGATRSYRFTITVQTVAAAQGKSASGSFTWEARG